MPGEPTPEVAFAGHRFITRVLVALALCSVIPILLLGWALLMVAIPSLGAEDTLMRGGLRFLIVFSVVGMVVGGYIIWDIGRTMARLAQMIADESAGTTREHRHDEVGTLMHAFTKMLGTIDQQAAEINSFTGRLDAAYKELESTNARLKEWVSVRTSCCTTMARLFWCTYSIGSSIVMILQRRSLLIRSTM